MPDSSQPRPSGDSPPGNLKASKPMGPGPGGPPPMPDRREMRRHCFRLIREVTGRLGWKFKLWIPTAMVLSLVFLLPQWYLQYFTKHSQNGPRLSETTVEQFLTLLIVFGASIAACQWIAIFLSGVLREWLRLTVSVELRRDAVTSLSRTRIDRLDSGHRGDWMTRMTGDLRSCEFFLTDSLTGQIRQVTMLLGTFGLFLYYSGPIAIALIPAALLLLWFNTIVQRRMGPTLNEARVIEGDVFQSMIETFEGLRTIRSLGAEQFTLNRIERQLKRMFDTGMRIMKSMAALMGTNEVGSQLVITAILTLAAYRISEGTLTAADALVYPFYINMFLGSAKALAGATYEWNRFFIEGGRLAAMLYDESKQVDDQTKVFGDLDQHVASVRRLSVENLTLGYGNQPPVVAGFDFTLKTGEIIAVMGPSGCGKSTFLEAFSGLRFAHAGTFTVEMSTGEVRTFSQSPVFLSAFVEQQPYLFVGTIRDNVIMGLDGIPDEAVWQALEEVGLAEMVRFRGGLDQVLTDRGKNLSVGQQYRLALCRALVCGRPFLLMDEPFAALDLESVERVVDALHDERNRGAGIVLITHLLPSRLETTRVIHMQRQR